MTRQEVLQWEVDNRNLKNRAEDNNGCSYYIPYKTGCAVGRLMDRKKAKRIEEIASKESLGLHAVFDLFPEDVKSLGLDFLQEMQWMHDESTYFTTKGLSPSGIEMAKKIAKKYNLNIKGLT